MSDQRGTILIVDDHPDNLRYLAAILSTEGYKVRKAINGEIALETVRSQPPDLILLDIRMPQIDGYEVCTTLKTAAATREIPVIFLSALNEAVDKVKAFTVGGVDYITKPFQAEEVVARIENQLHFQRLSKQLKEQNAQLQNEIRSRQQTEVILQQEICDRKKAQEQLQDKSEALANFSSNLKQLHRLSTSTYNTFEELFADYLQTGCNELGFSTGIISQIDDQTYTILAVKSDLKFLKPLLEFNLGDTYCAAVVKTKRTIAYDHLGKIPQMQRHPAYQNLTIKSYIGTPIFVNGEIYGTLNFSSTQVRYQDCAAEKEKEFIELMAQSLGREIAAYQAQMKREQAEEALLLRAIRLRHQNQVLLELASNPAINQGNFPAALKAITQAIAQDIAVERASVWLFDATATSLQCLDLFERSLNRHSAGLELLVTDYPTYFQALLHEQLIVADNAHIAPETKEFSQVYLTSLGITSMLDAPIRLGGKTVGVLCSEHVGAARHWTAEDQNFVRSAADLVSLALEARERQQAQQKLRQAHAELEQRAAELMVANTQLQQTLEELKKSETNLATAQRVAHVGNWEFDVLTQEISCSEELLRIFGLDLIQPELSYATIIKLIHPDDRTLWQQTLRQAIASGNSYEFDFRIVRKDGQVRHVEARGEAIFNDSFEVKRLFGTILDISEHKQVEKALRESENLYRQMFETNQAVKLVINSHSGAIIDANPAAHRFYGYKLEELKRMKITDLNVQPPDQELVKMVQIASEQHGEFRFRHRLASGEIRDVAIYFSPITRQGQKLLYSIIHDITQRLQAEEALRQSTQREREKAQELKEALEELKRTQSQLIQTEKMSSLGRMVAGVAHEFNNPVSFIHGNLIHAHQYFQKLLSLIELYQQTYPHPTPKIQELTSEIDLEFLVKDWSKLMHSMQMGTQRIQEIVLSLKNFSRLDEAELKPIDIHEGIDNTLVILQHLLRAEGHRPAIEVIKDYGQLPRVTCYASQLNQVFMNLLSNAIDALENQPEPRVITIRTETGQEARGKRQEEDENLSPLASRPSPEFVVIRIADNGFGMSEDVQKKIFDPFFTTKTVGSGTGLGLSISYQIVVEKHGGQLSCISAPGKGTEFIVEIPVQREKP